MPLVRFGVKNEYNLGIKELYKDGVLNEDPKAVLDGVAVAGLVGVLRQLGDLAQFAAEVFHDLQEQVASTSSRSRKLVNRVQRIEASLPSVEKAILSQTDHLRFAYAPGSEVHACIRIERNHFIGDDLPPFVMDSYEECKEPPRLQLLDRFDSGGPGSCLKRYSDPTFFKRASCTSEASKSEKSQQERKARKIKKRRSRSEQLPKTAPILNGSGRMHFSSTGRGQSSLSLTGSTFDMHFKSDLGYQSDSRGSKEGVDLVDSVSHPRIASTQPEMSSKGLSSSVTEEINTNGSIYYGEQTAIAIGDTPSSHAAEATFSRSSNATWDETLELYEPGVKYVTEDIPQAPVRSSSLHELKLKLDNERCVNQANDWSESGSNPKSTADELHLKTSDGNLLDPTRLSCESDEVPDYLKTNFALQEHYLELPHLNSCTQMAGLSEGRKPPEPTSNNNSTNYPEYSRLGTGEAHYLLEANYDVAEKKWEMIDSEDVSSVNGFSEDGNNIKSIEWERQELETAEVEHISRVDELCEGPSNVNVIEWSEQDLETANPEHVRQGDAFSEGGNDVKVIEWNQPEQGRFLAGHVIQMDTDSDVGDVMKLNKWNKPEMETQIDENASRVDTYTEGEDTVQVIDWNEHDDVDSGTDNFVDALYTIDSESESDFEAEMKKEVPATAGKDKLGENTVNNQMTEMLSHIEPEHQSPPTSYLCKEERNLEKSTNSVSSAHVLSPDHTWSSHVLAESATGQKVDVSLCLADVQFVETSQSDALSNDTQDLDTYTNDPVIRVEPAVSETSRSDSENVSRAPHVSQETDALSNDTQDLDTCTNDPVIRVEPAVSETSRSDSENVSRAPHVSQETSVGSSTTHPVIKVEPAVSEIARSSSEAPGGVNIIRAPHVSQETSFGSSTTYPVIKVEPAVSEIARSGSEAPGGEKNIRAPYVSQETSVSSSTTYPVIKVEPAVSESARSDPEAPVRAPHVSQETFFGSSKTYPVIKVEPAVSEAPGGEKNIRATYVSQETSVSSLTTYPVMKVEPAVSESSRSDSEAPVKAPHVSQETSVGSSTTYPVIKVEPAVPKITRSGSEAPSSENTIRGPRASQEASVGSSTSFPVIKVEPAVSEIARSGSAGPGSEKIICAPQVSQETSGSSTTYSPALWTNGTLFGLAPSKPVVCSMPNSMESAQTRNSNTFGQCSRDAMQKIVNLKGNLALTIKEPEHGNKSDYYGQYVGSSNHLSPEISERTHDTSVGRDKINSSDHPAIRDLINGDAMFLGSKVPVGNNVKYMSSDATSASEDRSSLLTVFSRNLLKNGLRRSGSLGYDERNESSSPSKSNEFDYRCHNAVPHPVPERNLVGKLESPVNSPPPSPPLEHMKISFQPADGFDASRLQLKYPEGIDQYETTLDAFPSFQLIPESTKLKHNYVSDSDNDTFCRSYACMSDESHSHQSDSDSEQWESGGSTESNDHNHTLYDGLHRSSSADSSSTSPQHEETDHANMHNGSRSVSNLHALSDPSFPLSVLDANNQFAYQEVKPSSNPGVNYSHLQDSTHDPPPLPLPPLQWRISRPLFDEVVNNRDQGLDSLNQSFVPKLSDSLITHPAKVDSAKLLSAVQEPSTIAKPIESATVAKPTEAATVAKPKESATIAKTKESATIPKPKKVDEQRFGQEQEYHAEKERKMDDGGDFLHQIRTKSFNLKRTEPTRPVYAPTLATSNKMTAILQKASAIRQAVGSDDGEDDSWSDT